ncbi:MAG TPA: guanylate kinase [Terriglobales bacterium]|nr:guanylate kinase [Terriglobales bacterium]
MSTVYIISAPSGSGKSTLVEKVRKIVPGIEFSISYTTRPPRGNEQNGVEYFFVSPDQFDQMIRRGEFLEHAEVFGNCYGTAKRFLEQARQKGYDLLLDIDVQGAAQIKGKLPEAVSIFILPPDRKTLESRLRNRSLDKEEVIQRRLVTASREIEKYREYDYILINDRLEDSVAALKAILLAERWRRSGEERAAGEAETLAKAERCRLSNVGERLQPILASFAKAATPGGR